MLRHRRWGGTEESFANGGKYVHLTRPADPNSADNQVEGPALIFYEGAGTSQAQFDRIALVAEPITNVYPTVPAECAVDELGPLSAQSPQNTPCITNADCQGSRTCKVNANPTPNECVGFAGAACCSHASPGACVNDGHCSTCNPHGGDGHTFRLRSKLYPTMYVVPSTSVGAVGDGARLVFSNAPSASGADGSLSGAWTMMEKPDHFGFLSPYDALKPDGCVRQIAMHPGTRAHEDLLHVDASTWPSFYLPASPPRSILRDC